MSSFNPPAKRSRSTSVGLTSVEIQRLFLDRFPDELLEQILLECSAGDLQGLRVTSRKLRTFIDSKRLLDQAIKRAGLPSCSEVVERLGDWPNMLKMMLYLPRSLLHDSVNQSDSESYKLMVAGGLCTVCGKYAGGPPYSSNLRVRLCGESNCMSRISSNEYTHFEHFDDTHNYQQSFIVAYAQVPYMNSLGNINYSAVYPGDPQCESNGCRYLRAEYEQRNMAIALAVLCPEPELPPWQCPQELALRRHEALEPIHYAFCAWRHRATVEGRDIYNKNLDVLKDYARDHKRSMDDVLMDPLIQRVLFAHARDQAYAYPSTFTHLRDGKGPPNQKTSGNVVQTSVGGGDGIGEERTGDPERAEGPSAAKPATIDHSPSLARSQPIAARRSTSSRSRPIQKKSKKRHDPAARKRLTQALRLDCME
ncbi:uncharacterized protein SCHCODRAFT_02543856 [Schizophyllum commune H4-8]|nr:uncharacterized protein SCHCODRAFT_02543856 [Schizophyllum commune H4-8]KAI5891062.1 hypothetical protein SCHCODRAFT_02543856 [Schizophyllum commune H4-8]